jgi:hypothetical protein
VFFAFDLLHLDGQDLRRTPLIERRAALRGLIEPDLRSPIQFSDHLERDGAKFFKAVADLGFEASCLSELPAGIAAVGRAHGSRPRTWSRANSSYSARGLRQGTAQWFGLSLRVRGRHLNAKWVLRHTTVKQLITD